MERSCLGLVMLLREERREEKSRGDPSCTIWTSRGAGTPGRYMVLPPPPGYTRPRHAELRTVSAVQGVTQCRVVRAWALLSSSPWVGEN